MGSCRTCCTERVLRLARLGLTLLVSCLPRRDSRRLGFKAPRMVLEVMEGNEGPKLKQKICKIQRIRKTPVFLKSN